MTYFKYAKLWYEFLDDLQDMLSDYNIQNEYKSYIDIVNKIKNEIDNTNKDIRESIKPLIREFLQNINKEDLYYEIPIFNNINYLDQTKLKHLSKVLDFAFNHKSTSSISNDKLIIKGRYVILRDFINDIKNNKIKHIEILALHRLYIDTGFDKTGQTAQVSIIAPTWDIIYNSNIILNGKNAIPLNVKKARDGMGPGADGSNGIPGYPGFPGGNFIGIAQNIINNDRLTIQTIGGKGGAGQDGGDGTKGGKGKDPDDPNKTGYEDNPEDAWRKDNLESYCDYPWYSNPYSGTDCMENITKLLKSDPEYEKQKSKCDLQHSVKTVFQKIDCRAFGSKGKKGGDAGHGGHGGYGGNPGKFYAISLLDDVNLNIKANQGDYGRHGNGGKPGEGGDPGAVLRYYSRCYIFCYRVAEYDRNYKYGRTPGSTGITGKNKEGIESPITAQFPHPIESVTRFKSYLRENIKYNSRGGFLKKFNELIDKNEAITELYDTLGLVNALISLENQYYKLEKDLPLLPYYQDLLTKINDYAINPKNNEKSIEYKKILSFLYTSTLSKINCIKYNTNNDLVIDFKNYIKFLVDDIKELKKYDSAVEKNKVKSNFEKGITERITEANNLVNEDITPELHHIMDEMFIQIDLLIKETIEKQEKKIAERRELEEDLKKLESGMLIRGILGVLSIASQALVFLGPIGATVGAVIGGASQIGSQFAIDDKSGEGIDKISSLPSGVSKGVAKIAETFKHKQLIVKEELKNVVLDIEKYLEEEPSRGLEELRVIITDAQKDLLKEVEKADAFNQESIDRIIKKRKNLANLLKEKEKTLKKEKDATDVKTEKQLKIIGHVQTAISMGDSTAQLVNSLRNDKAKIAKTNKAIEKVNKQLEELQKYEDSIYEIMVPMCRNMENSVSTMGKTFEGKSHAALDIKKWKVQSALKDIQLQIRQMTKGFEVNENITRCVEKFEYGVTTMVKLYDRIQDYKDRGELADYISDITSPKAKEIKINDKELLSAIDELNQVIHSNIVLGEYMIGMNAVKQHIFPFAQQYLGGYELPTNLQINNATDALITFASNKISNIDHDLSKGDLLINQIQDSNIFPDVIFSSNYRKKKPFFIWKHDLNEVTVSKLLNGKEIIVEADISKGIAKNAIKFKEIGIYFKTLNKSKQNDLNKALEPFSLEMIHLGPSRYRCGSKVYKMYHDKQIIKHSVIKNNEGKYDDQNEVYTKMIKNDPSISPYTTWKLRLWNQMDQSNYDELSKFKDIPIDLELEGRGLFVDHGIDSYICNNNLELFYSLDDVVLENNNIDQNVLFQESLEDIEPDDIISAPTNSTQNSTIDHQIKRRHASSHIFKKHAFHNDKQYTTNGSNSNIKNSIINNILGNIIYGLTVINYLNPFKSINDWFKNDIKTSIPYINDNNLNDIKSNINTPLDEYTNTSNNLIIGDNNKPYSKIFTPVNYDLLITNGNLLLLDLLIRKNNGMYYESNYVENNMKNNDYAHDIAYNAYVPK